MKKISYAFLFLLILVLTSCGSYDNDTNTDGIPFVYYDSFVFEDITYEVYEVENIYLFNNENLDNQIIKYEYEELERNPLSTDEWIINYLQDYDYHMNQIKVEKDVVNKMYENIYNSIIKFEENLKIDLEYYPSDRLIEREFLVDETKEYTSILLIDLLIPYRLVNTKTDQTNIIYIPVKTSLAYRNNDVLEIVFDNLIINVNYSDFISLSNKE